MVAILFNKPNNWILQRKSFFWHSLLVLLNYQGKRISFSRNTDPAFEIVNGPSWNKQLLFIPILEEPSFYNRFKAVLDILKNFC